MEETVSEIDVSNTNDVLFIFDVDRITTRLHLENSPLSLAIFTELVDVFKDIGIDGYMFKYIREENLIICNSSALTIEYMNSLKEKVKAERNPIFIEKVYEFKGLIRHVDILNSEIDFCNSYKVSSSLLCCTFIDYDNKTITIKSRSGSIKRSIPYYVANLILSCDYIRNFTYNVNKLSNGEFYVGIYRDLIKELYKASFVNKNEAVTMSKEQDLVIHSKSLLNTSIAFEEPLYRNSFTILSPNHIASNSIGKDFIKPEDDGYKEIIDEITNDDVKEFFELNSTSEDSGPKVINPFNIYDRQDN